MEKNKRSSINRKIHIKNSKNYILLITCFVALFAITYLFLTSFLFESWFRNNIVYAQIGTFSPYFFTLAMTVLFFGLLLSYRTFRYGLTSLIFILISIFSLVTSYLFGWLNWNPVGTVPQTWLFEIQLLTSTLSLYFLYFHFELNDRESPRSWLTVLITIFLLPYCLKNLYSLITGDFGTNTAFQLFLRTLVQIGAITTFVTILLIGIKMAKSYFAHSRRARILGGFQFAGIVLLFINIIYEFTEGLLDVLGLDFSTYNTPIFVISILLISVSHFVDPELLGLVPPNVQAVSLIDDSGITHYYKALSDEFADFNEKGAPSQLIGGLTIAFANVGEEVAKSEAGIDSLKFGDRAIIIKYLDPYYLIIIAEKGTFFLKIEMKEYLNKLKEFHPKPPIDGTVISDNVFKELNREFFPILTPYYFSEVKDEKK